MSGIILPRDIVLIVDDLAPRNSWVMGRIFQAVPDMNNDLFIRFNQDQDKQTGQTNYQDMFSPQKRMRQW